MSENLPAIVFEEVVKRFRVGLRAHRSIGDEFRRMGRFLLGRGPLRRDLFEALKGVSFRVDPGESLGIIGPNGSGKSTILKLIAGISRPTEGRIRVRGRVAALIEVTAGFHPELTGRENVYLSGTILGMTRREIADRFDEIQEFSGIGDLIDTPVKRYSSGMNARLGFSVAAHVDPEILLVDEVLSVGDFAFQQKCVRKMHELRDSGITVVFVSHNLPSVLGLCERTILIHEGVVAHDGPTAESISRYHGVLQNVSHMIGRRGRVIPKAGGSAAQGTVAVESIRLSPGEGAQDGVYESGCGASLRLVLLAHRELVNPQVMIQVSTAEGLRAFQFDSSQLAVATGHFPSGSRVEVGIDLTLHLTEGEYTLSAGIFELGSREMNAWVAGGVSFFVVGRPGSTGVSELRPEITGFKPLSLDAAEDREDAGA